jgi:hypothetical protein
VEAQLNLSVVVMAHERRRALAEQLALDLGDVSIVWDRIGSRWDTGRRSMAAYDRDADWHMVVQDDVIPCRDFVAGAAAALEHVPMGPVCFYTGKVKPHGPLISKAVKLATDQGLHWLNMPGPIWGPAIAVPTSMIDDVLREADKLNIPNYDMRLMRAFMRGGVSCRYSLPSLVDHRTGPKHPSLVPGRSSSPARTAHTFIGDASPLDVDWATDALKVNLRGVAAEPRSSRMAEIAPHRIYGTDHKGRRVLVAAKGQPIPRGFNFRAEQGPKNGRAKQPAPAIDYSSLKQPQLKALLEERGIEYPKGPVKNAVLVELLEGSD